MQIFNPVAFRSDLSFVKLG